MRSPSRPDRTGPIPELCTKLWNIRATSCAENETQWSNFVFCVFWKCTNSFYELFKSCLELFYPEWCSFRLCWWVHANWPWGGEWAQLSAVVQLSILPFSAQILSATVSETSCRCRIKEYANSCHAKRILTIKPACVWTSQHDNFDRLHESQNNERATFHIIWNSKLWNVCFRGFRPKFGGTKPDVPFLPSAIAMNVCCFWYRTRAKNGTVVCVHLAK